MAKRISLDEISVLNETSATTASYSNNSSLDNVNYLLYLETLKRFKDDRLHVQRQAEEKARLYEEAKAEYRHYYELYVRLCQLALSRNILDSENCIDTEILSKVVKDINVISSRVAKNTAVAYLNPDILEQCRDQLRNIKNYEKILKIQNEMDAQNTAIKSVRNLNESIHQQLDVAATKNLDYFVELLQNNEVKDVSEEFNLD